MDNLVVVALQEIASEGIKGCALPKLWNELHSTAAALGLPLNIRVKQILWKCLIDVPGLQYKKANLASTTPLLLLDVSIQDVENAEKVGVILVASEDLRDSSLGIYDLKYADCRLSDLQRAILERLARARSKGVPQNQLGKEFGVEGNKLFYVLRGLEIRGLLVRQSIILRNDEAINNENKGIVSTNLVHLSRYAKHLTLGAHQRFEVRNASDSFSCEINSSTVVGPDAEDGGTSKGNKMLINDDLPAIKAICDKLEEAEGKVLVVSDIKLGLGYRMAVGHRAWRRLIKRMQGAGLVKIFNAEIDRKVVSCIRLCKSFDVQAFDQTDTENDQLLKGGKRGQITELVMELPIDQQIFDMVQKEQAEGLPMMDIWKRLGLNNKRNYYRVHNMITKHGIVFEAENHKRCMMYRLRTSSHVSGARGSKAAGSHAQEQTNMSSHTHILDRNESQEGTEEEGIKKGSSSDRKRVPDMRPLKRIKTRHSGPSSTVDHATVPIVKQDVEEVGMDTLEPVLQLGVDKDIETVENANNFYEEPESNDSADMTDVKHFPAVPADLPLSVPYPSLYRVGQPYPCVTVTTTSVQREKRILERLEREKFIVRAELHRWLEDQENRTTMMDRKTLTRVLQKLQRENRCKCVLLNMPGSTNCGRNRTTEVILLPSIVVQPDLLCRIHESVRKFEIQSRANCVSRGKKSNGMFPVLTGVKRMSPSKPLKKIPPPSGSTLEKAGSMQANGFVPAKMVRVRMLHLFLWDYISCLRESNAKTNSVQHNINIGSTEATMGSYKVFALGAAMQAIPLESFLQIVGSTKKFENLADRVKRGLRLCDLPSAEHAELMDGNARGRLSWLVDVLRRLKLVRLVVGSGPILQPRKQVTKTFLSTIEAALTYAMEIHPFIEEPASELLPALNPEVLDVTPRAQHEFNFCNKDDVDAYWQTLEYFFSDAEPSIARQAFPGSNVPELFGLRSWTSLRVMSVDQRNELLKRIGAGGVGRRISAQECAKIAKDLNLTLEQVLKVSYEKNQSFRLQSLQKPFLTASDLLFKGISKVGAADSCYSPREVVSVSTCAGLKSDKYRNCSQAELESNQGQPDYNVSGEQQVVDRVTQLFSTEQSNENKDDAESEEEMQEEYRVNYISVVSGLKPFRRKRFPWSDKLDRILVVSYARQRALLGSRYNRVDWATLRNIPAPPVICRRRMAQLKSEPSIRFAIMNLCQLFSDRYEKHQQHIESLQNVGTTSCPESMDISKGHQTGNPRYGFIWDDVEDHSIVGAVEEIIKGKALARRRIIAYTGSGFDNLRSPKVAESFKEQADHQKLSSSVVSMDATSDGELSSLKDVVPHHKKRTGSVKKSLANYPSLKRIKRKPSLNDRVGLEKLVRKSLSVANAVEFIKLIYLNIPASEENVRLPKQFADGLRLFKEHDVFAAFNFLRQRDLVAFQQSTRAFTLSPKFYFNVSKSRFPEGTFEACANTSSWLNQKNTELQQDWIPFSLEIGCGQLLHLFQLATAGELSVSPSMPRDGIGESDEPTNLGFTKKKFEMKNLAAPVARSKTWDAEDSCETSRRERGFPGIQVSLHLASMPVPQLLGNNSEVNMDVDFANECDSTNFKGTEVFSTYNPCSLSVAYTLEESGQTSAVASDEFNLATCLKHWSTTPKSDDNNCVNCDLLRAACQIVDQAGEDGVTIEQLAESLYNDGGFEFVNCAKVHAYIEALQSLNLVEQVNAYDHVRIVGMSHCQRYFLRINPLDDEMPNSPIYLDSSTHGVRVDGKTALLMLEALSDSPQQKSIMSLDLTRQHNEAAFSAKDHSDILNEGDLETEANSVPMLPWLTMDGCINSSVFNALLHRVVGIVVLNPGIMEDDLVKQLDVLNPQTSRQLLQVLELGGYFHVRMTQIHKAEAPYLLQNMIKQKTTETKTSMERSYYPCSSFTSMLSPITISSRMLMDH